MTYNEKCHLIEIDTRGRFITMACDIEFTLLLIMANLAPDPYNHFRSFTGMMMHGKIQNTIADVKNYRPILFNKYEQDLLSLWEFKEIRNDLCHYPFRWGQESDFKSFKVLYVDIDENNVEHLIHKPYTIEYILQSHDKFKTLNLTLMELLNEIRGGM